MSMIQPARKVSTANFGPARRLLQLPDDVIELKMGTITGRATGVSKKTSDRIDPNTGEVEVYIGLRGIFEAHSFADDVTYKATLAYLPDFIQREIEDRLENSGKVEGAGITTRYAEFAYMCKVVRDPKGTIGYKWEFVPLFDEDENADPLASLKAKASVKLAQLTVSADKPAKNRKHIDHRVSDEPAHAAE